MNSHDFLAASRATQPFRDAAERFLRDGRSNDRVAFDYHCPPVKVERALAMALKEYPHLPIESIEVRGVSGCEYFRGVLVLEAASERRHVAFHWDCKWRAEQLGWRDYFGFPDQARAAREFGYDCFRAWEEEKVERRVPATFQPLEDPRPTPSRPERRVIG